MLSFDTAVTRAWAQRRISEILSRKESQKLKFDTHIWPKIKDGLKKSITDAFSPQADLHIGQMLAQVELFVGAVLAEFSQGQLNDSQCTELLEEGKEVFKKMFDSPKIVNSATKELFKKAWHDACKDLVSDKDDEAVQMFMKGDSLHFQSIFTG